MTWQSKSTQSRWPSFWCSGLGVCTSAIQATTNVTAEETFEEDTAIVRGEYLSQPTAPAYSAPCCGASTSEGEGDQSFYNELCEDLAALGQGSMLSFLQQLRLPSAADVGEWMTTTPDHPGYSTPSPTFPLYDTTLPCLDFNNACHNTNNYLNSAGGEGPPVSNLEEHLDPQERETQQGHTTWVTFHSKTCCGYSTPCDQGSIDGSDDEFPTVKRPLARNFLFC